MKRLGALNTCLAVAALFCATAQAASVAERADAILLDMLGAVSAVRGYEARFVVQTQQDGRMRPPQRLYIKQRRQPSCIYTRWLNGPRVNTEQVFCSGEPIDTSTVRRRARTLMNRRELSRAQLQALQVVLRPVDDEGLYGMVARYAGQYFDAAQNARPGDFAVGVRRASVFDQPSSCLRIRRREPVDKAPFAGQTEICVYDLSKLPSAYRSWDAQGVLLESYRIGDYRVNPGLTDADFELEAERDG